MKKKKVILKSAAKKPVKKVMKAPKDPDEEIGMDTSYDIDLVQRQKEEAEGK